MDPIDKLIHGISHASTIEIWTLPLIVAALALLAARFAPWLLLLLGPLSILVAWSRFPFVLDRAANARIAEALGPELWHWYVSAVLVLISPLIGGAWRYMSVRSQRPAA